MNKQAPAVVAYKVHTSSCTSTPQSSWPATGRVGDHGPYLLARYITLAALLFLVSAILQERVSPGLQTHGSLTNEGFLVCTRTADYRLVWVVHRRASRRTSTSLAYRVFAYDVAILLLTLRDSARSPRAGGGGGGEILCTQGIGFRVSRPEPYASHTQSTLFPFRAGDGADAKNRKQKLTSRARVHTSLEGSGANRPILPSSGYIWPSLGIMADNIRANSEVLENSPTNVQPRPCAPFRRPVIV
ncbi:hypothetical protein C8Q74DRAFT_1222093 [Fomes fomentarius]|nr:hypothetical protein C8Q74DRAFT_1222093 [Fomes fomentarius]